MQTQNETVAAKVDMASLGFVVDLNAPSDKPREHQIIIGKAPNGEMKLKTYKLGSDTPTPMPIEHAMKFLVDKSFVVTDGAGKRIEPVIKREGGTGGFKLAPNEIIADLSELTKEALQKRAMIMPGSEELKASASKDTLIEFIMAQHAQNNVGKSRGSEGVIGEATGLESLFGD